MRIGVLGHGFIEWTGGFDFLRIVLDSLLSVDDVELTVHLLLPIRGPHRTARLLIRRVKDLIKRRRLAYPSITSILEECEHFDKRIRIGVIDIGTSALQDYCRRESIDALLPALHPLPPSVKVPWVGYIFDFQHKHLPELFSETTKSLRDCQFKEMLVQAKAVIVNAATIAEEAARYHPGNSCRIFPLPFSADMPNVVPKEPASLRRQYGIQGRFFMICNQFWCHKDHATGIKAFAAVSRDHPDVKLVLTGLQNSDPRDPEYMNRLHQLISDLKVSARVVFLGLIPKSDQIGLMADCVAVIQPTLSEGGPGGGAVFDAVGLGVRSIVSDLAVNREIDEPTVRFFKTSDSGSLALKMREVLTETFCVARSESLRMQGRRRRVACGGVLLQAIEHARGCGKQSMAARG
jgi:glycosyltransferase involved in cell wall biosynthesis